MSPSRPSGAGEAPTTDATFSVITLVCADVSRSREFYRTVMGLTPIAKRYGDWVEFDLGAGVALRLYPKSDLLGVRPGSLQLGFTVEDVDAFVASCAARGIPVFEDPYDEPSGRVAVIGDPDGYPIAVGSMGSLAQ